MRNRIVAAEEAKNTRRRHHIASVFSTLYASHVNACSPLDSHFDPQRPPPKHCTDKDTSTLHSLIRVDTLDALWLFGLKNEFYSSRRWIETRLEDSLGKGRIAIGALSSRLLGGLLSAFDLSNRPIFLTRAVKLGEYLAAAYHTRTLPESTISLQSTTGTENSNNSSRKTIRLEELGTHQLEFAFIAQHTILPLFSRTSLGALRHVLKNPVDEAVAGYPTEWDVLKNGEPTNHLFSLNSPASRFYEAAFKLHRLTYKRSKWVNSMWSEMANSILHNLAVQSGDLVLLREIDYEAKTRNAGPIQLKNGDKIKMSLHVCGIAGVFGLYAQDVDYSDKEASDFLTLAEGLIASCMGAYRQSEGKLANLWMQVSAGHVSSVPASSLEKDGIDLDANWRIFESLMYMNRLTGDPKYRDFAWELFELFATNFQLPLLKSTSPQVLQSSPPMTTAIRDYTTLEMRFLTNVLKFLFLTFSDADVFPIDSTVWNSEGHPLTRFKPDAALV